MTGDFLSVDDKGKAVGRRLKDADSGRSIYRSLRDADSLSSESRAEVQRMLDNDPPYDAQVLRETGQGHRCNLNFGEGEELLMESLASYVDLFSAVDTFISLSFLEDIDQKEEMARIIAEEFTKALRSWNGLFFRHLQLCQTMLAHGVAIAWFENPLNWRWEVAGLKEFVFPRKARLDQDSVSVAACVAEYDIGQFHRFLADEEVARTVGWNVSAVKEFLVSARNGSASASNPMNWEEIQEELKTNELFSTMVAQPCRVIHMWVREMNGKVSHYIFDENPSRNEFLYKSEEVYPSMFSAFTLFYNSVGNGRIYSVRGLGYRVFPQVQISNRLRSQLVDGTMLASSLLLQPKTEQALEDLALMYFGPYAVITPDVDIPEVKMGNAADQALPVLSDMGQLLRKRAGRFSPATAAGEGAVERTRYEVQAATDSSVRLSQIQQTLFYVPWSLHLKEVFRRMVQFVEFDPVARNMVERIVKRGVPVEYLGLVDVNSIRAVRALGAGSEGERAAILEDLASMAGAFDETGRLNLVRDRTALRVGQDRVDRYVPPQEQVRIPGEFKVAMLENSAMERGDTIEVIPNEMHRLHLQAHIDRLVAIFTAVEEGKADLAEVLPGGGLIYEHSISHMEALGEDPLSVEEDAQMRQVIQQLGEVVWNAQKHLERKRREEVKANGGEAPAQAGQPEPVGLNQSLQRQVLESQIKMRMLANEHRERLRMKGVEHRQKMALKDAEKAADIAAKLGQQ